MLLRYSLLRKQTFVVSILWLIVLLPTVFSVNGQTEKQPNETLKTLVNRLCSDKTFAEQWQIENPEDIRYFYEKINYQQAWQETNNHYKDEFLSVLIKASDYGLDKDNYHFAYLTGQSYPTLEYEVVLTHAMLSFYRDIANGIGNIDLSYNGLGYQNHCLTPPLVLANTYQKGSVLDVLSYLQPQSYGYQSTQKLLVRLNQFLEKDDFREPAIFYTKNLAENQELIRKLMYLGFLPNVDLAEKQREGIVLNALKGYQSLYDLVPDGILGPATMGKLSIPLSRLRKQLIINLNRWRVLNCLDNQRYIMINIPSASLSMYDRDSLLIRMKTVVGKLATPTPTLCTQIDQITFFPYFYVPQDMAINELLPVQQRDPTFFENNGYQLLSTKGEVIEPSTVNWAELSKTKFPYSVRQVAGCDNSLGIVKFDFKSPYPLYLHDTNRKDLFRKNKRYLSNACIRIEKPYELATILFQDRNLVDEFVQKRFDTNVSSTAFDVEKPTKLFITYITVDVDEFGSLVIYDDIYQKDL